jgi:CRP/FNR family cyclic AMP-dependent transcriptional regulator
VAAEEARVASAPSTRWERLLDLDGDLAEALGEDVTTRARDRIGVATVMLEEGSWRPQSLAMATRGAFALLVCEGIIVRELELAGTLTAELVGPGDLVEFDMAEELLLSTQERWQVSSRAKVAILDKRVLPALHAWPALGARLIARGARQAARASEQRAISQLPRVELRIRALLWHLAERWGRMGPSGVVVPLELTHTALGHLVGARRSTVTLALGELSRLGMVVRRDDGAWILRADSNPSGGRLRIAGTLGIAPVGGTRERAYARFPSPPPIAPAYDRPALTERTDRLRITSAAEVTRTMDIIARCQATCEAAIRRRDRWLSGEDSPAAPPS